MPIKSNYRRALAHIRPQARNQQHQSTRPEPKSVLRPVQPSDEALLAASSNEYPGPSGDFEHAVQSPRAWVPQPPVPKAPERYNAHKPTSASCLVVPPDA